MKLHAVVPTLMLCLLAPARAVDLTGPAPPAGVIGLLDAPALFGAGLCTPRPAAHFTLRKAPDANAFPMGTLEIAPIAAGQAGCSRDVLVPRVRRGSDTVTAPVPTREFKPGHPGLVVIDQRSGWFQILVGDDAAWLQAPPASRLHEYFDLILGAPVHAASGWDRRVCTTPRRDDCRTMALPSNPAMRVGRVQTFGSELWFRVEFGIGACEGAAKPGRDTLSGWIPAYGLPAPNGRRAPTLWFDPRGC